MRATLALLCMAITSCGALHPPGEFVCTSDDEVTERHIGVTYIFRRGPMLRISYTEGNHAFYTPQPGETCAYESAPR